MSRYIVEFPDSANEELHSSCNTWAEVKVLVRQYREWGFSRINVYRQISTPNYPVVDRSKG